MLDRADVEAAFSGLPIGAPLARSGQKQVWRVDHPTYGPCVLKILKRSDPATKEQLRREIESVRKLALPNVPQVYEDNDIEIAAAEQFYIVEQFVPGGMYRDHLVKMPIRPAAEVFQLGRTLLAASVAFESQQLVHRDVKPENIILDTGGQFWIIDFGLVRMLDKESLTASASRFGKFTPGYAPEEQMNNKKREIDIRCDLFAIGVVLHEAATGINPYTKGARDVLEIMNRVGSMDVPSPKIPYDRGAALGDFLACCLGRFRSRRPRTAAEALQWFEQVASSCGH